MFAVRAVPRLSAAAVRHSSNFTGSVVSGPPRVHVPFAEKMVMATVMTASFLAYPVWVMANLQSYKGHE